MFPRTLWWQETPHARYARSFPARPLVKSPTFESRLQVAGASFFSFGRVAGEPCGQHRTISNSRYSGRCSSLTPDARNIPNGVSPTKPPCAEKSAEYPASDTKSQASGRMSSILPNGKENDSTGDRHTFEPGAALHDVKAHLFKAASANVQMVS